MPSQPSPPRHNVFLDFLNRDSRQIYGLFVNYSTEEHVRSLTRALNVAALLCGEFCIAPPGFLVECAIAQEALRRRDAFLTEGLIVKPMREETLDEFFEKKDREYGAHRRSYRRLLDERARRFLYKYSSHIVERRTRVGDAMVKSWEAGPDSDPSWDLVKTYAAPSAIEIARYVPRRLRERGLAVTWPAVKTHVASTGADPRLFRFMIQHHYFELYIAEYALRIVTGLPFARSRFGVEGPDLAYDYQALRESLRPYGLWDLVCDMSAESLIKLRSSVGYFIFIDALDLVGTLASSPRDVGRHFAAAGASAGRLPTAPSRLRLTLEGRPPKQGWSISDDELEWVSLRLGLLGGETIRLVKDGYDTQQRVKSAGGMHMATNPRKVAVVYGRNVAARSAVFAFLRSLGLDPMEWEEAVLATGSGSPYVGDILARLFTDAQAVVVLLTGDDVARLGNRFAKPTDPQHERDLTPSARPNVLFEAGMALGRMPDRTVLVELGSVRPFSDVGGRHTVRISNEVAARQQLADRLARAGCAVNIAGRTDWHSAGDFDGAAVTPDK